MADQKPPSADEILADEENDLAQALSAYADPEKQKKVDHIKKLQESDWYFNYLMRCQGRSYARGDITDDDLVAKLNRPKRKILERYKDMMRKARLPLEHLNFLPDFMPDYFKESLELSRKRDDSTLIARATKKRIAEDKKPKPKPAQTRPRRKKPIAILPFSDFNVPGFVPPYFDKLHSLGMENYHVSWTGEWKRGHMVGEGTYTFSDGTTVNAVFKDSRPNGFGIAKFGDGSVYEGDFKNGHFHGHGKISLRGGRITYDGTWRDGRRFGKGVQTFKSGQVYEGAFLDGDFHGHGKLKSAAGHHYIGQFEHGLIEGPGTLHIKGKYKGYYRTWPRSTLRDAVTAVRDKIRQRVEAKYRKWAALMEPLQRRAITNHAELVRSYNEMVVKQEARAKQKAQEEELRSRRKLIREAHAAANARGGDMVDSDKTVEELDDMESKLDEQLANAAFLDSDDDTSSSASDSDEADGGAADSPAGNKSQNSDSDEEESEDDNENTGK